MAYDWVTRTSDIERFTYDLKKEIKKILKGNFIGFYIHGSLAMGGLIRAIAISMFWLLHFKQWKLILKDY